MKPLNEQIRDEFEAFYSEHHVTSATVTAIANAIESEIGIKNLRSGEVWNMVSSAVIGYAIAKGWEK